VRDAVTSGDLDDHIDDREVFRNILGQVARIIAASVARGEVVNAADPVSVKAAAKRALQNKGDAVLAASKSSWKKLFTMKLSGRSFVYN
jgi:hypothetical protein